MPATFHIDVPQKLVVSLASGRLELADLRDHMARLVTHADFRPDFFQVMDFRPVEHVDVTGAEIEQLANRSIFNHESKRAFIVGSDLHYGMARMFELYRDSRFERGIRVFRELSGASHWLNMDVAQLESVLSKRAAELVSKA